MIIGLGISLKKGMNGETRAVYDVYTLGNVYTVDNMISDIEKLVYVPFVGS